MICYRIRVYIPNPGQTYLYDDDYATTILFLPSTYILYTIHYTPYASYVLHTPFRMAADDFRYLFL